MEKLKRICVLFGGNSSERDVSIESGRYIYESILKKGYSAELIDYKNVKDHIFFTKYDFIFIDPPFSKNFEEKILSSWCKKKKLYNKYKQN